MARFAVGCNCRRLGILRVARNMTVMTSGIDPGLGPTDDEIDLIRQLQDNMAVEAAEHRENMRDSMFKLESVMCDKFRVLREERGWSQQELSEKLSHWGIDMHQTTVAKMEKGKRPLRVAEMFALSHVFGLPPGAVFFMPVGPMNYSMEYMTKRLKSIEDLIEQTRESSVSILERYMHVYADATADRERLINAMRDFHS